MWLTERLVPDHKTIADFRKDNGAAIRRVCYRFVELARRVGVLSGGHRRHRREQVQGGEPPGPELHDRQGEAQDQPSREEHHQYLDEMARINRQEAHQVSARRGSPGSEEKLARIRDEVRRLEGICPGSWSTTPDGQISLTDPDARSMATYGKGTGGRRLQRSDGGRRRHPPDRRPRGHERRPRPRPAGSRWRARPRRRSRPRRSRSIADRGYFNGAEILACHEIGITATVPEARDLRATARRACS